MQTTHLGTYLDRTSEVGVTFECVGDATAGIMAGGLAITIGNLDITVRGMDTKQLDKLARQLASVAGLNVIN